MTEDVLIRYRKTWQQLTMNASQILITLMNAYTEYLYVKTHHWGALAANIPLRLTVIDKQRARIVEITSLLLEYMKGYETSIYEAEKKNMAADPPIYPHQLIHLSRREYLLKKQLILEVERTYHKESFNGEALLQVWRNDTFLNHVYH